MKNIVTNSSKETRLNLSVLLCLFFLIMADVLAPRAYAQEEYCCHRSFIFPPFEMPPEQERDISGFFAAGWDSYYLDDIHKMLACPIMMEIRSYEGSIDLEILLEKLSSIAQKKPAQFQSNEQIIKNSAEYVWKGQLRLTYIDHIVEPTFEEGYDEDGDGIAIEYVPGYAVGGWKFTIQLYDIQHDAVVKEASMTYTGADCDFYRNLKKEFYEGKAEHPYIDLLEEMFNREFADTKQIILDYEKVPRKAEILPKNLKVEAGEETSITVKLTDIKGEPPKPWQRVVVKVEEGELLNGAPCCEIGEAYLKYAFLCDDGEITLRYKAPPGCVPATDHITIYNCCATRDVSLVPLDGLNDEREIIGEADVDLTCLKGSMEIRYSDIHNRTTKCGFNNRNTDAVVILDLEAEAQDVPMTLAHYKTSKYRITSSRIQSFASAIDYLCNDPDNYQRYSCTNTKPKLLRYANDIIIYYDTSGNAVSAVIPEFAVQFMYAGSEECRSTTEETTAVKPLQEAEEESEQEALAEKLRSLADQFDVTEEGVEKNLDKMKNDTTGAIPPASNPITLNNEDIPLEELMATAGKLLTLNVSSPPYKDFYVTRRYGNNAFGGSGKKEYVENSDGVVLESRQKYEWKFIGKPRSK